MLQAHVLSENSILGLRVIQKKKKKHEAPRQVSVRKHTVERGVEREVARDSKPQRDRDLFIKNRIVRIHFIIVMMRWTGR